MKFFDFIIYRARHAAMIASLSWLILQSALFVAAGATSLDELPGLYTSYEQLLGTLILLVLTPAFLVSYLIVGQRRSMRYGRELHGQQVCEQDPDLWLRPINARIPLGGAVLGFVYGLAFNTPIIWLIGFGQLELLLKTIVIGQVLLWTIVGVTFSCRFHSARAFNRLGETAQFDLLDLRKIRGFAKGGVDDVLAIVLLLALSTVQAIDAEFRFENYASAMLLAVPAAAFLFLLPMISLHRRLVTARVDYLDKLAREIDDASNASRAGTPAEIRELEALLQHRDRIRETLTWPIDGSVYSRLAVYVIIPPIAWFGAAFVEFGLDRILSGP